MGQNRAIKRSDTMGKQYHRNSGKDIIPQYLSVFAYRYRQIGRLSHGLQFQSQIAKELVSILINGRRIGLWLHIICMFIKGDNEQGSGN